VGYWWTPVLAALPAGRREVAGRPLLPAAGLPAAATPLGCAFRSPRLPAGRSRQS
jgi:hypothetical protein